jgi:hypothetical protein
MKKEIVFPVLLIILGILFILINLIVFISNGNGWFIKRKIKVGALIISLSGIFACGSPSKVSCYDQAISKEYKDSLAKVKRQDSIKNAEEKKLVENSISYVIEEQKKKDSLAKIKHKKKPPIPHTCYKPVMNKNINP